MRRTNNKRMRIPREMSTYYQKYLYNKTRDLEQSKEKQQTAKN